MQPRGIIGVVSDVAVRPGLRRLVEGAARRRADAGEAVADIKGVGDLALLAVADAVDPGRDLPGDDLPHGLGKPRLERLLVECLAALARLQKSQEIGRARQAADMGGEDAVFAALHVLLRLAGPSSGCLIAWCGGKRPPRRNVAVLAGRRR